MIPLIWSQSSTPYRSCCCTILATSNLLKDARKGGKDNKEENLVETEWEGEGDKKPLFRMTPSRWPEVGWASNRLTLTKPTEELCHPAPPHHCPMVMRHSEAPASQSMAPNPLWHGGKKHCGNSVTIEMGGIGAEPHRSMPWAEHVPEEADEIRNWSFR